MKTRLWPFLAASFAISCSTASVVSAAPIELNLYPSGSACIAPNAPTGADDGTGRYRNVGVPGMLVYLPSGPVAGAKRMAVVVCCGGGYTHLTGLVGASGMADLLCPKNVVVIALKYRLTPPSTDVATDALADGKRAIRLVRSHSADWGVDPRKIGMIGWSAGANLELNLASHFDLGDPSSADPVERLSSRPDFVVMLSPWPNKQPATAFPISKDAPPAYIGSARDDKTAPFAFAEAVKAEYDAAGAPAYFEAVDTGGHGAFGEGPAFPGGDWPDRFWSWLRTIGIVGN